MDHVTVCVCTYRRTHLLPRLFEALAGQETDGTFSFSVAVVDNDGGSSRQTVEELASRLSLPVRYDVEPDRNFARVRNRVVGMAEGDFVAFIDDDEVPVKDWLRLLLRTLRECDGDGVLGPVKPYFEQTPPRWIVDGRLCERPSHPTGAVLDWNQTRTGNVLLRRDLFEGHGIWFDPAYASGGEDVDFFKRLCQAGCRFVWCEEAAARELVPEERLRRSYFLKRALLQGAISTGYSVRKGIAGRTRFLVESVSAVAGYSALLPLFLLRGQHVLMKYLVKDCYHLGRVGAVLGFRSLKQRGF